MPDGQKLDNKSENSSIKKASIAASPYFTGAGDRNRTYDLRVTSALLYRLSYTGLSGGLFSKQHWHQAS